jgi:hypothetical protein
MWLPRVIVLSIDGENTSPENSKRGLSSMAVPDASDESDESKWANCEADMVPEGDFWGVTR